MRDICCCLSLFIGDSPPDQGDRCGRVVVSWWRLCRPVELPNLSLSAISTLKYPQGCVESSTGEWDTKTNKGSPCFHPSRGWRRGSLRHKYFSTWTRSRSFIDERRRHDHPVVLALAVIPEDLTLARSAEKTGLRAKERRRKRKKSRDEERKAKNANKWALIRTSNPFSRKRILKCG